MDYGGVLAPVSTAHTRRIASKTAEAFPILMTGAGRMVAFAFGTFYAGAEADYVSGLLSGVSMVFLVGGLMLVIAHILFALPNSITESVTRYIGQGQPTLGDETNDVRAKGNVVATTGVMTRALGGAAGRLGLNQRPGAPVGSRNQDHMQVDAVRQGDKSEGTARGSKDAGI